MRRILIIAAGAIVIIGMSVAAYTYFLSKPSGLTVAPPANTTLPSSTNVPTTPQNTTNPADTGSLAATRVTDRLSRISQGPIVLGEVALDILASTTIGTTTATNPDIEVRYIERESGNIFSYLVRSGVLTRISNKTLPGIQAAVWLPSGQNVFATYLSGDTSSTVETYGFASDGTNGFFMPQGLAGLDIARATSAVANVLTLASGASGSVVSLSHADGTHTTTAFTTPLSSLRVSFAGTEGYLAFTKPSSSLPGDAYLVSTSGQFTRVAGPLPGLVALASPSGGEVLVSYSSSGVMHMELVNMKTKAVTTLPVATIADKCVWAADDSAVYCGVPVSPSSEYGYPDDWYQGAVHFSDRIWKINVADRYAQLVFDPSTTSIGGLDAEALALDSSGTVLVFINKNDGSLWSYQL